MFEENQRFFFQKFLKFQKVPISALSGGPIGRSYWEPLLGGPSGRPYWKAQLEGPTGILKFEILKIFTF